MPMWFEGTMGLVRVLGIDLGDRRVGLAVSDPSGTLARPLATIAVSGAVEHVADLIMREIDRLSLDDPIGAVVVGLPLHLDGTRDAGADRATALADILRRRTGGPVALQDERLTSREAESRLALFERDWRRRKTRLDAAAAAVILQDYLDARQPIPPDDLPSGDAGNR